MSTKPDEFYIEQTLDGEVNAFSFLVEKYQHMVFTLILRIVKDREEAEEIAQDVFVKAFNKLNKFQGTAKFSTWLYKIAYYASLDQIKRNKRTVQTDDIDVYYNSSNVHDVDVLSSLHNEERTKVVNRAIAKLAPQEQAILTLYYFEEMSIIEVAKVVKLSVDNVKVKLFRSRKKMLGILDGIIEPRTIDLI